MLELPHLIERRARVGESLNLGDAILVVRAGDPVPLPENTDQTYPYLSHSEYVYLSGMECPGAVIAFDPREGACEGWRSFVPEVSEAARIWEGQAQVPGRPLGEFDAWIRARADRPVACLGAPDASAPADMSLQTMVRETFHHARRVKDAMELDVLRRAAAATAHGFEILPALIAPGVTERALQIELEAAFFRAGANRTGYATIVGTGPNAAVLHFAPTSRAARAGEFVLIDAGAEIDRYVCDVTRTYVVGTPDAFQRDLHQLVLHTEARAIAKCRPRVEWREVHLGAAHDLVTGLVHMGVMRGRPESLVEQDAHLLFFPHGIGHMVGLGVRDASGTAPGRARSKEPALRNLRMDLPLQPDYVVTVEPGVYFIPALLNDPARRARYKDAVDWDCVDRHIHIGGVRIEDNVRVMREGSPEVLTEAIPREF